MRIKDIQEAQENIDDVHSLSGDSPINERKNTGVLKELRLMVVKEQRQSCLPLVSPKKKQSKLTRKEESPKKKLKHPMF